MKPELFGLELRSSGLAPHPGAWIETPPPTEALSVLLVLAGAASLTGVCPV